MIVSHRHEFIFCHVSKTAGESITEALDPHLGWDDVVLGVTDVGTAVEAAYRRRYGLWKHATAPEIRDVVGDTWTRYRSFAVVRHPVARTVSLYHYLGVLAARDDERRRRRTRRGRRPPPRDPAAAPWKWSAMRAWTDAADFSGFIRDPRLHGARLGLSQADWLTEPGTDHVLVDRVCRFEHLAADFADLCDEIGLAGVELGWRNRSAASDGRGDVSSADAAHLCELYRRDLELFGYEATVTS